MELIYQENDNECGACVVAMLANEINDLNIDRSDVINKANLSSLGMSAIDLEELASQFGINLEAYECEFNEIKELDIKKWYVALVRRPNGFHYIIFKHHNNVFTIYDSAKGSYKLKGKEFQQEFANVIFTVSKINFDEAKIQTETKFEIHQFISWKMFFTTLIINLIGSGLGLLIAQLFKTLINGTIAYGSLENLLVIIIPFVLIKFIEILFKTLNTYLINHQYKLTYKKWWYFILEQLVYHDFDFYKKTPFGTLHELDNHLGNIIDFYQNKISQMISNTLFSLVTFIVLATTEPIFILISIVQLLSSATIIFVKYYYQKRHTNKTMSYLQNHNKYLTELFFSVSHENNWSEYKQLAKLIKKNINDAARHNQNVDTNNTLIDHIFEISKFIFWTTILAIGINLVIKIETFDLSTLMYVIALQTLFSSNADGIITFAIDLYPFKISLKKFYGFCQTLQNEDVNKKTYNLNEKIEKIQFEKICLIDGAKTVLNQWSSTIENLTVLVGKNGAGKSSLCKAITSKVKLSSGHIKINDLDIEEISKEWIVKNVIYLDGNYVNTIISESSYQQILKFLQDNKTNNNIVELYQKTKLLNTNPHCYSTGQYQLARLITLNYERNKLILLDESLSGIHTEIKPMVFEQIVKPLTTNNFVVIVEHDPNIIEKCNYIKEVK